MTRIAGHPVVAPHTIILPQFSSPSPQCNIDLRKNSLTIGTTGTETKFLPENQLPPCARWVEEVFWWENCLTGLDGSSGQDDLVVEKLDILDESSSGRGFRTWDK